MEEKEMTTTESIKSEIEKTLGDISNEGISRDNVDYLEKLLCSHNKLEQEDYWEVKKMYYRDSRRYDYDRDDMSYGRGRRRDSRGRYKGHDMIDEMSDYYGKYMETRDGRSYGGREDSIKSLDYMMASVYDFVCMLEEDVKSDEEMDIIRKYARKISEL